MATNNFGFGRTSNTWDAQTEALQRRRRLSELLKQQAMGRTDIAPGGRLTAFDPISKVLLGLMAKDEADQADTGTAQLEKDRGAAFDSLLENFPQGTPGQEQVFSTVDDVGVQQPGQPAILPKPPSLKDMMSWGGQISNTGPAGQKIGNEVIDQALKNALPNQLKLGGGGGNLRLTPNAPAMQQKYEMALGTLEASHPEMPEADRIILARRFAMDDVAVAPDGQAVSKMDYLTGQGGGRSGLPPGRSSVPNPPNLQPPGGQPVATGAAPPMVPQSPRLGITPPQKPPMVPQSPQSWIMPQPPQQPEAPQGGAQTTPLPQQPPIQGQQIMANSDGIPVMRGPNGEALPPDYDFARSVGVVPESQQQPQPKPIATPPAPPKMVAAAPGPDNLPTPPAPRMEPAAAPTDVRASVPKGLHEWAPPIESGGLPEYLTPYRPAEGANFGTDNPYVASPPRGGQFMPNPPKLNVTEAVQKYGEARSKAKVADLETAFKILDDTARKLADDPKNKITETGGEFSGNAPGFGGPMGLLNLSPVRFSEAGKELDQAVRAAANIFLESRSGKAVTATELSRFLTEIGQRFGQGDAQFWQGLKNLRALKDAHVNAIDNTFHPYVREKYKERSAEKKKGTAGGFKLPEGFKVIS